MVSVVRKEIMTVCATRNC